MSEATLARVLVRTVGAILCAAFCRVALLLPAVVRIMLSYSLYIEHVFFMLFAESNRNRQWPGLPRLLHICSANECLWGRSLDIEEVWA